MSAAEEERFSRRKHHAVWGHKSSSIDCVWHVLQAVGGTPETVTHLVLSDLTEYPIKSYLRSLFPDAEQHQVEHHLCHAAAAFFASGFSKAAILSLDGFGDNHCGLLAVGGDHRVVPLRYLDLQNSIGLLYLQVTHAIGLGTYGSEGKTQGLAAYGRPQLAAQLLERIHLLDDGRFTLDADLQASEAYLGEDLHSNPAILSNPFVAGRVPHRGREDALTQMHMDAAASVQAVLDEIACHCAARLRQLTGLDRLVLTGGVAQNSTTNGRLLEQGLFSAIYAHPASADRGNGLGAALHFAHHELDYNLDGIKSHVYHGQAFGGAAIEAAARRSGHSLTRLADPADTAAQLLADGRFVGWFQGRSEVGARALGNRSILADPRGAGTRDALNHSIKHREWFRPFAPSILVEAANEWLLTGDGDLSAMMFTVPVRETHRTTVPAVSHVDGSARAQTVGRDQNSRFYRLIERFRARTDIPVVLNTSFNDAGEPIVESPDDAFATFERTGLDALIIGDFGLFREKGSRAPG